MSRRARFIWLSLLIGPVASAQSGAPGAQAPETAPPAAADIPGPQRSTVSGPDMVRQGKEYRTNMDRVLAELQTMVEQSRKQKDVIRLNCVMDKLAQVKVSMNIADEAIQKLQEGVARNDDGLRSTNTPASPSSTRRFRSCRTRVRPAWARSSTTSGRPGWKSMLLSCPRGSRIPA